MTTLTKRTRVDIHLLIMIAGIVAAFVRLESRVDAEASATDQLRQQLIEEIKTIRRIDRGVANMQGHFGIKPPRDE